MRSRQEVPLSYVLGCLFLSLIGLITLGALALAAIFSVIQALLTGL